VVPAYFDDPQVATAYKMLGALLTEESALGENDGAALVLGTIDGVIDGLTDGVEIDITEGFTEGNILGADIAFLKLDVQINSLLSSQPLPFVQSLIVSSVVHSRAPAPSHIAFASSQVLLR